MPGCGLFTAIASAGNVTLRDRGPSQGTRRHEGKPMRSYLGRGLMLTAFAGTFVLAAGPAALAATPATTSPEAMSLVATGSVPIGPVGDATLSNTNPVTGTSGVVTGILGIGAFTDNVQTNA